MWSELFSYSAGMHAWRALRCHILRCTCARVPIDVEPSGGPSFAPLGQLWFCCRCLFPLAHSCSCSSCAAMALSHTALLDLSSGHRWCPSTSCSSKAPVVKRLQPWGKSAGVSLRQAQAHSWAAASVTAPPLPACLLGMCCRRRTARRTARHGPASAALIHAVMPPLLHKPRDHSKPHLHQVLLDAPVAAAPERGQREGKGRLVTMHVLILIKQSEVGTHQRLREGGSRFEGVDG